MHLRKLLIPFLIFAEVLISLSSTQATPTNSKLFREYIGAEGKNVRFSDVPIYPNVDFHFILSFGIDYTTSISSPSPTNGNFSVFWDTDNLTPSQISSIKAKHRNVKVAVSLGGDTVGDDKYVYFQPSSVESWVGNAVSSLTKIIDEYNLDGIDIDYEHFVGDPEIFSECIGRLITTLKRNGVIEFASIAPYEDDAVQNHYLELWRNYADVIDYINFQFYAYDRSTTIPDFLKYFEIQSSNYKGGTVLVSFGTDKSGGLKPNNGFFTACRRLRREGKLNGIFVWSADDSKASGFPYERQSQVLLGSHHTCSRYPRLPCELLG
ncbi:hypothetical protein GIB67_030372 [Kingdonia uniflora]|uniref:GH18 domain-containing protein n=1 Tax=Kingdonia uniflora TaxID=39325 RepID=A0A7J7M6Q4_9MAGN|nr:hypothetical protein GIB67_030372 [Kingdonia uniflora]